MTEKNKINYPELVTQLAEESGLKKVQVEKLIDALRVCASRAVENRQSISIPQLFDFKYIDAKKRNGFNPRTKEPIVIPAQVRLRISPKEKGVLAEALNKLNGK